MQGQPDGRPCSPQPRAPGEEHTTNFVENTRFLAKHTHTGISGYDLKENKAV